MSYSTKKPMQKNFYTGKACGRNVALRGKCESGPKRGVPTGNRTRALGYKNVTEKPNVLIKVLVVLLTEPMFAVSLQYCCISGVTRGEAS